MHELSIGPTANARINPSNHHEHHDDHDPAAHTHA